MRIQHNIPAMSSYRNYSRNVSAVNKNLEKLSSGYRINRAGDDAAGLAISEKMRLQISGLEQAQNNAKSGINLVQTAEGALTEVHDMLNRMYTLAEQSANGTYSDDVDREQLQKEVESLRKEIDRIADATNYNGIKLLDGSLDNGATPAVKGETKSFVFAAEGATPGAGELPAVDNTKINAAGGTVLHKGASADTTKNTFGVEFHSAKIEGDKGDTFTLTIGDVELTGTLEETAQGEGAITAEDLVAALAGEGSDKFTLTVEGAEYNKDEIAINGGKFAVTESGTGKGVVFTQTDEAELTGGVAMDVTLAAGNDEEPTGGQAPTVTETADTAGTDVTGEFKDDGAATTANPTATATGNIDFANTTPSSAEAKADNTITFSISGENFVVTLKNGDADADEVTAGTQIDIAGKANSDIMALAVEAANKQIAARNATKANDAGHADYAEFGQLTAGNVTGNNDGTITITGTVSSQSKTWDATLGGSEAKATVDFTGKTGADVIGSSITIDGKTYEFVKTGENTTIADAVKVEVGEADVATALATKLAGKMTGTDIGANVQSAAVGNNAGVDDMKVIVTGKVKGEDQTLETSTSSTENVEVAVSGQWNWKTTDQNLKAETGEELLAQTSFDLTAEMAAAGAKIRFGETEYTFTDDKDGGEGTVYVGDLDFKNDAENALKMAAQRLTDAAAGNDTWSVAQKDGKITLTEQVGYTQEDNSQKYDLSTEKGIKESLGFTTAATAATEGDPNKGLTLQIGDTAERFNKLNVSVKDMHAAGLKIDGIDIKTQAGASAAMEKIKAATNMVSDVRGSLGALQNRLDHTINNLSVTQENIQDAESTIRDVDIAKEMMAHAREQHPGARGGDRAPARSRQIADQSFLRPIMA